MRKITGAPEELYAMIAAEFAAAAEKNPNAAFAFTAVDVPEGAIEAIADSGADFSKAQAFNACEYVGEAAEGEHSQAAKLNALLYEKTPFAAVHVPAEGESYDAAIREAGGLDLVLLGIGEQAMSLASVLNFNLAIVLVLVHLVIVMDGLTTAMNEVHGENVELAFSAPYMLYLEWCGNILLFTLGAIFFRKNIQVL